MRFVLFVSAKLVQGSLRLQRLVKPTVIAALQIEGAHFRNLTRLGCVSVVAHLPRYHGDGTLADEREAGVIVELGILDVAREDGTDLHSSGVGLSLHLSMAYQK